MTVPQTEPKVPDAPVLVIGYGSTLRGDDGVGPRVAELLEAKCLEGVRIITRHQLTPELAEPISRARLVIFVDAELNLPDEEVRVKPVRPGGGAQVMVHTTDPSGLLQLASAVFGAQPTAWTVGIPVTDMGIGEELSATALRGVEKAAAKIEELVKASVT